MKLDKAHIAQCFQRALKHYDHNAAVQQHMNHYLLDILSTHNPSLSLNKVLEVGCGTGQLTGLLQTIIESNFWFLQDLCDVRLYLSQLFPHHNYQFQQGDSETLTFPSQIDLIASGACIQWFENQLNFLKKCQSALKSQGLLLFSTFGPHNLIEIKQIMGIGLNYPTLKQWQSWLLNNDFTLLHIEQKQINLQFSSVLQVLKHLQQTGVTATNLDTKNKTIWTKKHISNFNERYFNQYGNGQTIPLTYNPIYVLAKKN